MPVIAVTTFKRFVREAGGIDVDKNELHRYEDFVERKMYDLFVRAQATARANDWGVIDVINLPVTKGLEESMHRYKHLDLHDELTPLIGQLPIEPQLDLLLSGEATVALPDVAGGLSMAVAQAFRLLDPKPVNPSSIDWERALTLFGLLL